MTGQLRRSSGLAACCSSQVVVRRDLFGAGLSLIAQPFRIGASITVGMWLILIVTTLLSVIDAPMFSPRDAEDTRQRATGTRQH